MNGNDYAVELEEAREILNSLRKAYKEHAAGRGMTKRYKIKDREMELLTQIGRASCRERV
mgnify:CR=1 FL=1